MAITPVTSGAFSFRELGLDDVTPSGRQNALKPNARVDTFQKTDAPGALPAESTDPAFNSAGITPEEATLIQQQLLPPNYGELKAAYSGAGPNEIDQQNAEFAFSRKGLSGPFQPAFGDWKAMLSSAKQLSANPQLAQLYKTVKKGDILVLNYQDPSSPIARATNGPYTHAMICTSEGPPPQFVEAMGVTGDPKDPSGNQVRRVDFSSIVQSNTSVRLIRPTANMGEPTASQTIDKATSWAEAQLGKPYDYSFSDHEGDGTPNSFYCSELATLAYSQGADLAMPVNKEPQRDDAIASLHDLMTALGPDDESALCKQLFTGVESGTPIDQLLTQDILPRTKLGREVCQSPQDVAKLQKLIQSLEKGTAFPKLTAAKAEYERMEKNGDFNAFGVGGVRRAAEAAKVAAAAAQDVASLATNTGINLGGSGDALGKLLGVLVPHLESIFTVAFGPKDPKTQGLHALFDVTGFVKGLPGCGNLPLPTRAPEHDVPHLITPNDLAWSNLPYEDFNVQQGSSMDNPSGHEGTAARFPENAGYASAQVSVSDVQRRVRFGTVTI